VRPGGTGTPQGFNIASASIRGSDYPLAIGGHAVRVLCYLASFWFPPRRAPSRTSLTVLHSNNRLGCLARPVRSELMKDNSFFLQGPRLWQVRVQVEASPPDLHHATIAAGVEVGGLMALVKALPCQTSAADMNRLASFALPSQGSLQVAPWRLG
jgi:hypothetical protein